MGRRLNGHRRQPLNDQRLGGTPGDCVDAGYAQNKKQEETNMTIDSAKDLQMNIAKEGLALLMFHPSFNVQPHRVHLPHWHSVGHPRG